MPPLESQALEAGPTSQDMGTHRKGLIRIMCSPRTQTHDLESRKGFQSQREAMDMRWRKRAGRE